MSTEYNSDDSSIEENVPTMRSVAMMAPPVPLARVPLRSGLAKTPALYAVPKAPPPSAASWNVTKALKLPSWHPLGRSHVLVSAKASEISQRIADFLLEKSIAAEFSNEEAVCRAETACGTKFCIRLWQKETGVIVDAQRSTGCGFIFHQVVKGVVAAVKGSASPKLLKARPMPRGLPAIPSMEHEENVLSGVKFACDSLEASRFDSCLLAIQSLVRLTEDPKCKGACAQKVLNPSGSVLPKLLKLVKGETSEDPLERDHFAAMHRNATTVLANCLEALPTNELQAALSSVDDSAVLEALLADVRAASSKPHEAATACRCLKVLRKVLPLDPSLSDCIMQASYCRHALLREHCSQLLDEL